MKNKGLTTQLVHLDRLINPQQDGAVHSPVSKTVPYEYQQSKQLAEVFQGKKIGHVYSRSSSSSVNGLQNILADLEKAASAVCFATGMAAMSATLLSLLKAGDHLIASQFLFGNTLSLLETLQGLGIEVSLVDVTDVQQVAQAYQTNTKMVMLETIANPVTQVADLKAIGTFCQQHGLIYLVDNTMTPAFMFDSHQVQASLLICSLTKYFAGHGQALGGALIDTGLYDWHHYSNIASIYKTVDSSQWGLTQIRKRGLRDMGATLSGDAAHAIAVGMETMELRLARSCENALGLARFLSEHPLVEAVYYPGLTIHPQHQAASEYFSHYGGILSIDLASDIDPFAFLDQLQLVISATHLGDTRTLALPVAHTIFYENGAELRQQMGVSDGMIRISAGIETLEDLIADFTQAFNVFI